MWIFREGKPDIKLKAIQETIQLQFEQQQQQLQQQSDPKAEYAKKVSNKIDFSHLILHLYN